MKTCVDCHTPAAASALRCNNCGSVMFAEAVGQEKLGTPQRPSLAWDLFKWTLGYYFLIFVIGTAFPMLAIVLFRSGIQLVAQGIALAPNVFIPLAIVMIFAFFASKRSNPIAHAAGLFAVISVLGLGLNLLIAAGQQAYISETASTFMYAALGTTIGAFFSNKRRDG